MKNTIVTAVLVLVALFTCEIGFAQELTLDKEVHDYGTIKQGANGECVFVVKNTGSAPLIISNCKGSCGCTVPQCDKAPIAPGGTQEIKVKYDTKRVGPINKSVTITSNATNTPTKMIRIKGNVLAKEPVAPAK
ncbi:MAG: hypothetical protein CL833_08570 [Crocinitomicaceae bacterium]|nr:hypothetical protein [Crocinitomicaceae bacterium]